MEGRKGEGNLVVRQVVVDLEAVLLVVRVLLPQSRSDGPTGDKCWKEFAEAVS